MEPLFTAGQAGNGRKMVLVPTEKMPSFSVSNIVLNIVQSIDSKIRGRILGNGSGRVFTPKHFQDLSSSVAIASTLRRLKATETRLNATGRAAVVLDTGTVSRDSGSVRDNKEKTVRQLFVDRDLVESMLYLQENRLRNHTSLSKCQ